MVTTPDGELLDSLVLEIPDGYKHVAVEAVNYSIGRFPNQEVLDIGERNP